MTLVVSEVSDFGIVMVADSAITTPWGQTPLTLPSGKQATPEIRRGAQKIVPITAIGAAISIWGFGTVQLRLGKGDVPFPIDLFVRDFAETVGAGTTLEEVGNRLADTVNDKIPVGKIKGGFHLAGYTDAEGKRFPALYHVHTGHGYEPLHELRLYHDYPFDRYKSVDEWLEILKAGGAGSLRNGAFDVYAIFWKYLDCLMDELAGKGFVCPSYARLPGRELEIRRDFIKLQVQTICEFYRLSNFYEVIAGPLSSITISSQGIERFELSAVTW